MKYVGIIALALLVVVGIPLTIASCHSVPAGHRGVVVTFGSVDPQIRGEGLTWANPFALIHDRPIQQGKMDGAAACFSSDLQTVQVQFVALYRQAEAKVAELYQLYQGDPYGTLIEPRIQECLKEVTATYPAQELVKKREEIRRKTLDRVRASVGDLMIVNDINIVNIDLTKELEQAIELKMVMEQQAQAKSFELDRERKNAEITVVKARAEAEAVTITGAALATSPKMIELEVVKRWNGVAPTTLVVGQGGGANVVFPIGTK